MAIYKVRTSDLVLIDFFYRAVNSNNMPGHIAMASDVGGTTPYVNLAVNHTSDSVKASPGQLYGGLLTNRSASDEIFVKIYDKAASVDPSTDVPKLVISVKAGTTVPIPDAAVGVAFAVGIQIRACKDIANAGTTDVGSTNDMVANLMFC